jgi:hypothetical protein
MQDVRLCTAELSVADFQEIDALSALLGRRKQTGQDASIGIHLWQVGIEGLGIIFTFANCDMIDVMFRVIANFLPK